MSAAGALSRGRAGVVLNCVRLKTLRRRFGSKAFPNFWLVSLCSPERESQQSVDVKEKEKHSSFFALLSASVSL